MSVRRALGIQRSDEQRRSPWGVLAENAGFRWYFGGSVVSDLGTWLQNTAQVLLAYQLSHSVLTVGLVTCAQFSSPLVLGPWAGVAADRIGGRRALLYTEIVSAIVPALLALLEFTHHMNEAWLVAGAIASGLAFTFALPARNVTVRRLVDERQIRSGYAMDSVSYNIGRALAPPACVLLIATAGFGWAFVSNAASFCVFSLVLAFVGRGRPEPVRRSRVRAGFLIAFREPRILIVLAMVAAVTVAADPVLVLGPALATHVFHVRDVWSGAFIAALGSGGVAGSMRRSKHRATIRLAASALAALGVCMICFVLAPTVWLSVVAAFAAGGVCLVANSATRTLLAVEAGAAREASVMAVWAIAWAGSKPIASLADGILAGAVGVKVTGVLMALPVIVPLLALPVVLAARNRHRLEQAVQV